MANKQTARRRLLKPLYPAVFLSTEGLSEIPPESVTSEIVGKKAFGLSCLPKQWTLPFIVISGELLSLYKSCPESGREQTVRQWTMLILKAALSVGIEDEDPIIVRSSASSEGLEKRGDFYSEKGTLRNVLQPLLRCLDQLKADTTLQGQNIPLVVQRYASPISEKGHLSNETRFYEEGRDWIGNFDSIKTHGDIHFRINLRNWRRRIDTTTKVDEPLECNLVARISEVLKVPASWMWERKQRIHFEWVWDGKAIYLVQADQEQQLSGVDPTIPYNSTRSLSPSFLPKCLKEITAAHSSRYNKISNVNTYIKLGLPMATRLYILDNQDIINDLAIGKVTADLEEDIRELVKDSLVIRMDVATDDPNMRQLLPRTDGLSDLESALTWLKDTSAGKRSETNDDIVFIFHNFVPSVSSAFAYAAPGKRNVQIEALWGLPEGLYYNAHDKYIVDTLKPNGKELTESDISRFKVRDKPRAKRVFVAPDEDGRWTIKNVTAPFDWRPAIQHPEWVKKIAIESRRIAEEEGKSISIMWFVGVPGEFCPEPIVPWHHEPYDSLTSSRALTHRTKTPFDTSLNIRTSADIDILKKEATDPSSSKVRRVRIEPREEKLLRDKDTLRTIGELAKKINAVILLEGGVLSHAYYQLMQTNANVEVLHPFEDLEDQREFNKLVRDKVPSNIEYGGEIVTKFKLSGEFFLRALREKLVEEAFEALDATDQDSIIGELADLTEVIDGILSKLGVSHRKLKKRQGQKREKAGGFKEGIILLKTINPLPAKKSIDNDSLFDDLSIFVDSRKLFEQSHAIDRWTDRRGHQAAKEVLLRLVFPVVIDKWSDITPRAVIDSNSGSVVQAEITGKRLGSKFQIEVSLTYTEGKQLKLL